MCGIIGLLLANEDENVNQMLFDGLTVLQHRGQDAAGIVTAERRRLHLRKDNGLVKDVFQQHHMMELRGNMGIGHCRYPTAGSRSCAEAQPLYTNYPYGICLSHNGNLTNSEELTQFLAGRHVNTDSDSELLLNLFANHLATTVAEKEKETKDKSNSIGNGHHPNISLINDDSDQGNKDMQDVIFSSIATVMSQCEGGYAGMYLINGVGLVGFRDPHGIRPLVFGCRQSKSASQAQEKFDADGIPHTPSGMETVEKMLDYVISSESVAIDTLGFQLVRDVKAGEAIFIDMQGNCHTRVCHTAPSLSPCIFEYVYFARPDSIMDGVSVYESRLKMGEKLANRIKVVHPNHEIDVVIPIPDTSRTSALQAAYYLNRPFREGFIKNRYIARTFIMPGQETRVKSVRLKLNTIKSEFAGKNVLLVDDSIVRGTTAHEIVLMARDAGAKKVFFSSAAPPIRYPNIYGIDIPTQRELIAYDRNEEEIAAKIGCDWVLYQDLQDLRDSITEVTPAGKKKIEQFDTSCFSGEYVTGQQVGDEYFTRLHNLRNDVAQETQEKRKVDVISGGDDYAKSGGRPRPEQSNNGCESMSNDKRRSAPSKGDDACEPLTNQPIGISN